MQSQSVSPPPSKKEAREQALPVAELHTLRSASNSPAAPPPAAAPEVQPSSNGAAPHTAHKQKQAGGVSRIPHAPSAAAASSPSAAGTSLTSAAAASARKTAAAAAAGADAGAAPTANGSTSTGAAAFKPSKVRACVAGACVHATGGTTWLQRATQGTPSCQSVNAVWVLLISAVLGQHSDPFLWVLVVLAPEQWALGRTQAVCVC